MLGRLTFDTRGWNPVSRPLEQALDAMQMTRLAGKPNPTYDMINVKPETLKKYDAIAQSLGPLTRAEVEGLVKELVKEAEHWAT